MILRGNTAFAKPSSLEAKYFSENAPKMADCPWPRCCGGSFLILVKHCSAGRFAACPLSLALLQPGLPLTRHVVSASQMMISALLIQRTGRCIETHIQVFGSLGRV